MTNILEKGDIEKDDRFNVNSAIGYACFQQKKRDKRDIYAA